jgi:predicted RNase H-like HicB family nuclease
LIQKYAQENRSFRGGKNMLIEYVNKAMSKAVYDKLDDGTFTGKIPQCPGVVAFGESLYQCEQELRSSLEGWLIVKIRHGDKLPIIGKINLNNKMPFIHQSVEHYLIN